MCNKNNGKAFFVTNVIELALVLSFWVYDWVSAKK